MSLDLVSYPDPSLKVKVWNYFTWFYHYHW